MQTWATNLIISSFLFSIIVLILPNGKISKTVKTTFGMIMILMVFTPIIQLKNIEFNISDLLFNSSVELQSNYIEFVYNEKAKSIKDNCKKIIEDNSILGSEINLIYTINVEKQFCVDYIEINLKNAVINSETSHINIVETIKKRLSEYLNIKTDNVVIYEQFG